MKVRNVVSALIVVACLLPACAPKRGLEDPEATFAALLEQVDRSWDTRGSDGYGPVHVALTNAEVLRPGHPEVAWRWARYQTALGLASRERGAARHAFSEARSAGLACLMSDPIFSSRAAELGWAPAVESLAEDREQCAVWTAFAWLRWMEHVGADAASLDMPRIQTLLVWLDDRGANPDGLTTWSRGIAQVLSDQARGLTSPRGRALLEEAVEQAPRELARVADFLILGEAEIAGAASARLERARRLPPANPEDERALERLQELWSATHSGG